jgi:transposase
LGISTSVTALNVRKMGRRWPLARALYGHRWHAESVSSRHKRRLGFALTARRLLAQRREILLRVLTYNLMLFRHAP